MKISIVTGPSYPVPAIEGGAIPRMWHGLAEEFALAGHQVTVFSRSHPKQPQTETINGVRYSRSGGFSQSRIIAKDLARDFTYALRTLSRLPQSDILIANDFWLPALARLRGAAIGSLVINANRFPKHQYFLYRGTAMIAAASRSVQEAIAKQTPAAGRKIKVIGNPINTQVFAPSERRRTQKDLRTILYVGRIHPEKGVHVLIDAFRHLAERGSTARLVVVGPLEERLGGGGEDYARLLSAKAKGLAVQMLGPVFEMQALADIYRSADLFCYPSLAETGESFGVAPLEAMATGLVPVVSELDCFRDFIEEQKTGFFFDHRAADPVSALASVMDIALLDGERLTEIGTAATRKASEFSFRRIAAAYIESFEALLSASHPKSLSSAPEFEGGVR